MMNDIPGILQYLCLPGDGEGGLTDEWYTWNTPVSLPARGWRGRVNWWIIYLEYSSISACQGMEREGWMMDHITGRLQCPISLPAREWIRRIDWWKTYLKYSSLQFLYLPGDGGGKGRLMDDKPGILHSPVSLPAKGEEARVDWWMAYLEYSSL